MRKPHLCLSKPSLFCRSISRRGLGGSECISPRALHTTERPDRRESASRVRSGASSSPLGLKRLRTNTILQAMGLALSSTRRESALGTASIKVLLINILLNMFIPIPRRVRLDLSPLQPPKPISKAPCVTMRGAFLCKPQGRRGRAVRRGAGDMPPRGASICYMGPFR